MDLLVADNCSLTPPLQYLICYAQQQQKQQHHHQHQHHQHQHVVQRPPMYTEEFLSDCCYNSPHVKQLLGGIVVLSSSSSDDSSSSTTTTATRFLDGCHGH
mmetsp:Transcript_10228/g.17157  ORF Transcript_10228/g.17157 Transcript_10228/m.17157 type:complete len:101 (-) Transcript_10228:13-315(-)